MTEFQREERYIVVKRKRIDGQTEEALREFLQSYQIPTEECVVVEHDWPIYEQVFGLIEEVATGKAGPPPAAKNFCRVFELPVAHPTGSCLAGGYPVSMRMVDWFPPWVEGKQTWHEVKESLIPTLKKANYVMAGRQYLVVTDFGECFVFKKEVGE